MLNDRLQQKTLNKINELMICAKRQRSQNKFQESKYFDFSQPNSNSKSSND